MPAPKKIQTSFPLFGTALVSCSRGHLVGRYVAGLLHQCMWPTFFCLSNFFRSGRILRGRPQCATPAKDLINPPPELCDLSLTSGISLPIFSSLSSTVHDDNSAGELDPREEFTSHQTRLCSIASPRIYDDPNEAAS